MLFGSLSLVGFPFLSGFYSKDLLLEAIYTVFGGANYLVFAIAALSTFLSSFYSFRLIYYVFFGSCNLPKARLVNVSEGTIFMYAPLIILCLFSIFSGYFLKSLFFHEYFYLFDSTSLRTLTDFEFMPSMVKARATLFSCLGIFAVYYLYHRKPKKPFAPRLAARYFRALAFSPRVWYFKCISFYHLSIKKLFSDALNSLVISYPLLDFSLENTYKDLDKGSLEIYGSKGFYDYLSYAHDRLYLSEDDTSVYSLITIISVTVGIGLITWYSPALAVIVAFSAIYNKE